MSLVRLRVKICFKMKRKVIPFYKHVKMFYEVSKAPSRVCLCYNVYPTQTIPYRTVRLPEMNYKISSKTYNFITRSGNLPDLTEQVYFLFLSSADNLCKQFGPRSAPTESRS